MADERNANERQPDEEQQARRRGDYEPEHDPDAGPPATEETVEQDARRDQAEG